MATKKGIVIKTYFIGVAMGCGRGRWDMEVESGWLGLAVDLES